MRYWHRRKLHLDSADDSLLVATRQQHIANERCFWRKRHFNLALNLLDGYHEKADKAHSSSDDAGSGIIGLLEVCESDFSKGLAEMTAAEETAATV